MRRIGLRDEDAKPPPHPPKARLPHSTVPMLLRKYLRRAVADVLTPSRMACLALLLALPTAATAQQVTISGVVTDAAGEALIGANVFIADLLLGASTDVQGRYSFEIPSEYTAQTVDLTVQYIGYSPETRRVVVAAPETTVNFVLAEDLFNLDEVVVTGVAEATPRKKLAFTVDQVDKDLVALAPARSPLHGLHGKVAGASVIAQSGQPGDGVSVRLRGSTSITGSAQPLYIVDGVVLGASQIDIDALDIENIEIVKGASASSLYGSRAQNGVIRISTRRGAGIPVHETRVTIRNEMGINFGAQKFTPNNSHNYRLNADGTAFVDAAGNDIPYGSATVVDGNTAVSFFDNPYPGKTYNAFDEFFDPGNTWTNSIAIRRNGEATNFLFSFANLREEGIIAGQKGYHRKSVRFNLDHYMKRNVSASFSGFYATSTRDAPNNVGINPFFSIMFTSPAVSLTERDEKGELKVRADPLSIENNPLYVLENIEQYQNRARAYGNVRNSWKPIPWFDVETNISFDRSDREGFEFYDKGYEEIDSNSRGAGEINRNNAVSSALNTDVTASFRKQFDRLVARTQFRWATETFNERTDFVSARGLAATGISDLSNVNTDDKRIGSSSATIRSEGFYAIAGADYADRYIMDALVRRDGSSLFGAEERWQTYFRVSGAYRLSEEAWWPAGNALPEFKVRASYGTAGARPCFQCQYETFSLSGGQLTKSTLGNSLLKPELQKEREAGMEFSVWNKAFLELVYAHSRVEDQLLLVPLSAARGYSGQWRNAGALESNTIEASLRMSLFRNASSSLDIGVVFDRTRQRITEFEPPAFRGGPKNAFYIREGERLGALYGDKFLTNLDELPASVAQDQFQVNDEGYVVWVGAGNTWMDGITGNLWGAKSETMTTPCGQKTYAWGMPILFENEECTAFARIGNTLPDFNLGLNATMRWRGLTAYMLWSAQIGGDIYNATAQWAHRDDRHQDQDQSGKSDARKKTANYMQALYHANGTNNHFVESGDYLKLREFTVEYALDKQQLARMFGSAFGLHRLRLGVTGRNLLTFTNYSGFDPETGRTSSNATVGGDASLFRVDQFRYPNFRTVSGRIILDF